ncbi:hypothetical protein [Paenibacillus sp. RC67]|uniref:hypothetical protein n=1 Tax=Paenibacillus sp. RC67 TaxID=3039392 RepID=UPI0024AD3E14|nr:hypothetical protein [Paenibacillus sp. RC67]
MNASSALEKFMRATEIDPVKDKETLLLSAYQLVKEELIQSHYAIESVRLAHQIFGYLGDKGLDERVALSRKYLQNAEGESLEDRFWANWELVDNLALLKRYPEMTKEQRNFLAWSKENMKPDYWIKVMYDSTQAIGWVQENQAQAWFEIYYELMHCIEPTASNRHNRVLYVETAVGLLVFYLKHYAEALNELERYRTVLYEDTSWDEFNQFDIRLTSYELGLYSAQEDWDHYEQTADRAIAAIESCMTLYNQGKTSNIGEICDMAHEIGTCLMWEKRYRQAMPLYEFALEHQGVGVTHFFYAVCVWATTKNKEETMRHLHLSELKVKGNGGLRSRYIHMFMEQPEFDDVREDAEFLAIFNK